MTRTAAAALLLFIAAPGVHAEAAGFAEALLNPPRGVGMTGFGARDRAGGNQGIHDDVYATALYLTDGREQLLIVGLDICFLSRDESDRVRGALGRVLDLQPRQILLNYSHSHSGPRTGTWYYTPRDPYYIDEILEPATIRAAVKARDSARPVTMWAAEGETRLPLNRRPLDKQTGRARFGPNPQGTVYNKLPLVLFQDAAGKPLFAIFSISAHPSGIGGKERMFLISADYPGFARKALKRRLGLQGAVFLQGAGGDSKVTLDGKGFLDGSWEQAEQAGEQLAAEAAAAVSKGLTRIQPDLSARSVEMRWPMLPAMDRAGYAEIAARPGRPEAQALWASDMMARLDQGYRLPSEIPILAQRMTLGPGFRMVAIEGEMAAGLAHLIHDYYKNGITMPLGYSNGCQLYLPTSRMIDEGGYEVESYWEYRFPAPLAKGVEGVLTRALKQLDGGAGQGAGTRR